MSMDRLEIITAADGPAVELAPGVEVRMLATGSMGALGLTTALASVRPGAELPLHTHPFSEVIVVVEGEAVIRIEGRRYRLGPYDAMHVPAGTPHAVRNGSDAKTVLHTSFASETPAREPSTLAFETVDVEEPAPGDPESLVRFERAPVYELSAQAYFRDLFARRLGSRGICGGYGRFEPGASLPCHFHEYDESITIVEGRATCLVEGREHALADCATACIPTGRTHRFINRSDRSMAMIWVYASDEPGRTIVDAGCCDGTLPPGERPTA